MVNSDSTVSSRTSPLCSAIHVNLNVLSTVGSACSLRVSAEEAPFSTHVSSFYSVRKILLRFPADSHISLAILYPCLNHSWERKIGSPYGLDQSQFTLLGLRMRLSSSGTHGDEAQGRFLLERRRRNKECLVCVRG